MTAKATRRRDLPRRSADDDASATAPVVFVVDDDSSIRDSLRRLLMSVGSNVVERNRTMRAERHERTELRRRYATLTPRERDVSARIVAGLLNKQIAGERGTSEATVKEQRGHVTAKMQAGSVAELVRFASRLGVTPAAGRQALGADR